MAKTIDDILTFFSGAPAAFTTMRAKEDADRLATRKAEDDDLADKRRAEDADLLARRQAQDAEYADYATAATTIKSTLAALPQAATA